MRKSVKHILTALALLVVFYAAASVVATLVQLADAADRVRMGAGQYVFWSLLAVLAALAASPFVLYFRLPKPLQPPETREEPVYSEYLTQVLAEMRRNPHLAGTTLAAPEDIDTAMRVLSDKVDKAALNAASATFVSTALMQNGRLDALLVLAAQFRLVWQITAIYHMRPTLRQVLYVYSNVGAAVLIASSIDDIDFAEIASPIVTAAAPALAGGVPGLAGLSHLLVNSLANGAANAFLTLRVAMLTKHYCAALVQPERAAVRKSASVAALALLGVVTRDCGARVVKGILKGTGGLLAGAASATAGGVKAAGAKVADAAVATVGAVGSAASAASQKVGQTVSKTVGKAVDVTAQGARQLTAKAMSIGRTDRPVGEAESTPLLPPPTHPAPGPAAPENA